MFGATDVDVADVAFATDTTVNIALVLGAPVLVSVQPVPIEIPLLAAVPSQVVFASVFSAWSDITRILISSVRSPSPSVSITGSPALPVTEVVAPATIAVALAFAPPSTITLEL